MFRYILVPAPGAATHDAVFRTALTLALQSAGHLEFLHTRLDMQQLVLAMSSGDFGAGGAAIGDSIDALQADSDKRAERARHAVAAFCAREGLALGETLDPAAPTASFRVATGAEARILAAHARVADITVIGRARDGEAVTMDLLEAVLLHSGRPILIAPAQPAEHIGRDIAIAWKDTPEAARAVASAMPLLRAARSVTIVALQEHPQDNIESCQELRRSLLWHNPATSLHVVPASSDESSDVLLTAIERSHADLLVMGGYSRSRMREIVFGGFTRRVLRSAGLPVLMAH